MEWHSLPSSIACCEPLHMHNILWILQWTRKYICMSKCNPYVLSLPLCRSKSRFPPRSNPPRPLPPLGGRPSPLPLPLLPNLPRPLSGRLKFPPSGLSLQYQNREIKDTKHLPRFHKYMVQSKLKNSVQPNTDQDFIYISLWWWIICKNNALPKLILSIVISPPWRPRIIVLFHFPWFPVLPSTTRGAGLCGFVCKCL